jgi:hypothetical protein
MLHALVLIALCCAPALVLLPLRFLDREPSNEIAHESSDDRERDPEPPLLARRVSASRWHYQPQ